MSAILDAIDRQRAALRNREDAAIQELSRRWLAIERGLYDQMEALALEIAAMDEPTRTQIWRSARWVRLKQQIDAQVAEFRHYASQAISADQGAVIGAALADSASLIQAAAAEAGIGVDFNRLPIEAVNAIIGQAGNGSPLAPVLARAAETGAEALTQQLINGVALGVNPVVLARRAIREGLGKTFTQTATIYRTEVLRAYRYTSLTQYRESNVVTGYQRLSARDTNTCIACLMADGEIYNLTSDFDQHPNCRCAIIPIVKGYTLPIGSGPEWFNKQSKDRQRFILGPKRFELWQGGSVDLAAMVTRVDHPDWGGALVPTTVRSLRALIEGGAP
jgi:SPP1 gp7 family putative phage head morphogenesis protein